jgi:hypothetical protein
LGAVVWGVVSGVVLGVVIFSDVVAVVISGVESAVVMAGVDVVATGTVVTIGEVVTFCVGNVVPGEVVGALVALSPPQAAVKIKSASKSKIKASLFIYS